MQHSRHQAFNGWRSASFPERSGVQQGSPLSPLLYVLAAQPLASHLRHQTRQGVIRSITMPNGQPAPVSHQHADDTTIHVLRPSDAQVALDSSIALFCAATCSQLNVSKSRGFFFGWENSSWGGKKKGKKWAHHYAEPNSTSKKHPPKHAAHHRDQDQCGSVPTVSYGLCSWHPWGWQGPPATEGGLTGPPR